jgi:fatty acid desaturase
VLSTWGVIAACFAVLARWPNALTFVLAVLVLGGRQLALAILMHEASHRTLFATRALNDSVADWLCARPIWSDVERYRIHHLKHHAFTNTESDPDSSLSVNFPTTRAALARKLLRDVVGWTGLKRLFGLVMMDIGAMKYTVAADVIYPPRAGRGLMSYVAEGARNMWRMALANLLMLSVLHVLGCGWVYLAWVVAYLTSFSVFIRIRSIAEHACTERSTDPFRNTRTTRAGWLARATVAPIHVNFHIEHHLLAAVPYFKLRQLHELLVERGRVQHVPGYLDVLRIATDRTSAAR